MARTVIEPASSHRETFHDQVGFQCQQSAEKYLKALMQESGLSIPHTHDLERLLALLHVQYPVLKRLRLPARILPPYAVEYRYPGISATKRQAESALRHAEKVRAAIRARLGLPV